MSETILPISKSKLQSENSAIDTHLMWLLEIQRTFLLGLNPTQRWFYFIIMVQMPRKKKELSPSEQWKWDIMDVEVDYDLPKKLSLYFY